MKAWKQSEYKAKTGIKMLNIIYELKFISLCTSVGTPDRMKHAAELITAEREKIIVLSAISGTTTP